MAALADRIEKISALRSSEAGVTKIIFADDEELSDDE
jgi:hypothetical protein